MARKKKQPELEIVNENADFTEDLAEDTVDAQAEEAEEEAPSDSPKKAGKKNGGKEAPNMLQALKDITSEENDEPESSTPLTLAAILGGDILGGRWFKRNFFYILMVVAMIIVYVSNRYACQQEMITTKNLSDTLLDRRYKALTRSSQLKEMMRRSHIEETLSDSTIQTANTPSFSLKIEE